MNKISIKFLFLFSVPFLFMFHSCVEDEYAPSNISKDVSVGQEMLSIPIGSTEKTFLNDLLEEDVLLNLDSTQQYSLNISDTLNPINVNIDPVSIDVGSIDIDPITIDFDYETVSDFSLDKMTSTSDLEMPDASVDGIELPSISNKQTKKYGLDIPVIQPGIEIQKSITVTPDEEPHISYEYKLRENEEIKTIHNIYFGDTDKGHLVYFHVDYSDINRLINKETSVQKIKKLTIEFPEEFVLGIDHESKYADYASIEGSNDNKFKIENARLDNETDTTYFSFYLKSKTVEKSGNIDYDDVLDYEMDYEIDGETADADIDSVELITKIDEQPVLNYAEITTAEIPVDNISPGTFNITTSITGLENISKINEVIFGPSSVIDINISDPELGLSLSEGQFNLGFPEMMTFDLASSNLGSSSFDSISNTLHIPASKSFGAEIALALDKIDLSSYDPGGGKITIKESVEYNSSNLKLEPKRLKSTEFEDMDDTTVTVSVPATDLTVEDAEVTTSAITSSFNDTSTIEVEEEVPENLQAIKSLAFKDSSTNYIQINVSFENIPSGVDELKLENFEFTFPQFLSFAPEDNVDNGVYTVTGDEAVFSPQEGFSKKFTITGFDFSHINNGDGLTTVRENGVNKIIIDEDNVVSIAGNVIVDNATLNYDKMTDISVIPEISIDPFVIQKFYGTLEPNIDPVSESIDFDIGGDLSFLQDDDNSLVLSNPQIFLSIGNTIGVPVDLTMDLYSKDASGNIIPGSKVEGTVINVEGAEDDGEPTISKFLISAKGTEMAGYETVRVENLPNLLKDIPDKISFDISAESDKSETHRVDLSKDMEITGDYKVNVPLQFDELNINYTDTIQNLGKHLEDLYDIINDVGLTVNMTIENSIPLELNLNVLPLNASGELISGITTSVEDSIPAGSLTEVAKEDVSVLLTAEDNKFELLDALVFKANVTAGKTVGASLGADQYIRFQDIKFLIEGGLEFDLND